jgi:hypothetical protein
MPTLIRALGVGCLVLSGGMASRPEVNMWDAIIVFICGSFHDYKTRYTD